MIDRYPIYRTRPKKVNVAFSLERERERAAKGFSPLSRQKIYMARKKNILRRRRGCDFPGFSRKKRIFGDIIRLYDRTAVRYYIETMTVLFLSWSFFSFLWDGKKGKESHGISHSLRSVIFSPGEGGGAVTPHTFEGSFLTFPPSLFPSVFFSSSFLPPRSYFQFYLFVAGTKKPELKKIQLCKNFFLSFAL